MGMLDSPDLEEVHFRWLSPMVIHDEMGIW